MHAPGDDTDFVYVPVPRSRVYEVMDLLRTGAPGDPAPSTPAELQRDQPATGQEPTGPWDEESLGWLIGDNPPLKQRVILEYLARNAGRPVSAADLRDQLERRAGLTTGYSGRALGAVLRGLKKRSAWYERQPVTPFNSWWDHDHGENRYQMPAEHGPVVLAALAALHGHEMADD
jgi:hypothetical protein